MWIAKSIEWHVSHTDLSKYFIEKLKQQVDAEEIISNRHRTTNGLTLVAEIIKVAELTKSRPKLKNRLISLLDESKSDYLSSNIVNDFLLNKYFTDIVHYYKSEINPEKVSNSEKEINVLINKSKVFLQRLLDHYYEYLLKEIKSINFSSIHFNTEAEKIDKIVECFIPYQLYLGYSSTSISEISYRAIFKNPGSEMPIKIAKHFNGRISKYNFLIKTEINSKELQFIKENLNEEKVSITSISLEEANSHFREENKIHLQADQELYQLTTETTDPHNFVRLLYDEGLKRYVASCDRLTLNYFTHFFDNVYWRFSKSTTEKKHTYQNSKIYLDPLNVPERGSTLRETLKALRHDYDFKIEKHKGIPFISDLSQIIYFYNLALGSKSIENSLSLLWTSLEMLIPYRIKEYDIQNVQHFVSKSLSVGAVSREIASFGIRLSELSRIENLQIDGIVSKYFSYKPNHLSKLTTWLCKEYEEKDLNDPYNSLKEKSSLLCRKYCYLNAVFTGVHAEKNKVQYWIDKIRASEQALNFQLDRIYLHRNQVVHSGKFMNEYSNLWSHLEWYVGKLIAFATIRKMSGSDDLESIFISLEADNEQLMMLLQANKDKKIKEIPELFDLIFKHSWQSF